MLESSGLCFSLLLFALLRCVPPDCVQLVGYSLNATDPASSYWLVRNSWNTSQATRTALTARIRALSLRTLLTLVR